MGARTELRGTVRKPWFRALVGSGLGNAPGFLLPFLVARHFGIGALTDAYAFALAVTVFGSTVAIGVIETNVLPAAQRARAAGPAVFSAFLRRTRVQALFVSAIYVPIAAASAGFVLARHRPAGGHGIAIVLIAELSLVVVLVAVNSVQSAGLYAAQAFLAPTASQLCRSVLPLLALPALGTGRSSLEAIALLMVVGEAARSLVLRMAIQRRLPSVAAKSEEVGDLRVWRFAAPHALNMAALSANPVIDRMVASSLTAGSVTTLDLAEKVFFVPTVAITSSILLIASARWSDASLARDPVRLCSDYRQTLERAAFVSVCLAALIVVPLVLFEGPLRAAFAGTHTHVFVVSTATMLGALPFFTTAAVGGRLIVAMRRTAILPWFAVAIVGMNATSDIVGARLDGVVGIAAGTVVSQALASVAFTVYCYRVFGRLTSQEQSANAGSSGPELAPLLQGTAK